MLAEVWDATTIKLLGMRKAVPALAFIGEADGPVRWGKIEEGLEASPKTLSDRLRQLEEEGLVENERYDEVPPRSEYNLTGRGRRVLALVAEIEGWDVSAGRWVDE